MGLRKGHLEVHISNTASETCCTLGGSYSEVQAALAQLLGRPGGPELAGNDTPSQAAVQTSQKSHVSEEPSRKPKKQRGQKETDNADKSADEERSSSKRDLAPGGNGWEAIAVGAASPSPATFTEDLSLIVDADMFQYLQKHCTKEYQRILSQYAVEVVTETNQGLTTLFLKAADAEMMEDRQERLTLARGAISCLYQENEANICRDQLPKFILHPRGGLQRAMDNLMVRFPKIILNEDGQNVYIIGNSRDVSEAKGALLLDHEEAGDKTERVAGLPSYNYGSSSSRADEERVLLTPPFTVGPLDEGVEPMLRSDEDELRTDGATKYKLAARFKDSGLSGLGSRPADFNFRPNSSPSRQTRHGPVLGHDVLSETTGVSGEAVSRGQNTGGDILFNATHVSSSASTQSKTSLDADTTDTQLENLTPPFDTTPSSFSESTAPPPFRSGSTLKRASSFSGTPQQKAQVVGLKSRDDSNKSTFRTRERSSSFSSQAAKDKQEVHNAEIPVPRVVWLYIKEAYSPRVKDLTTEVQMEESFSEGSRDLTVLLKGADSSKVKLCQERLESLVALVSSDFSVQELRLSDLGVADSENETLQACCSEVRSGFKKVTIHVTKKSLFVVGPVGLCSQVATTLREVFSGELEQPGRSSPSTSDSAASSQFSVPQSLHLNNSQLVLGTQTGITDHQPWKTTYGRDFGEKRGVNGSYSQSSTRKDLFDQAKVKEEDEPKADRFANHLFTGSDKSLENGDRYADRERTLHATQTGPRHTEVQSAPDDPRSDQGGQAYNCVCGADGTSLVRTNCGVTLCPKCLETRYVLCRVCTEPEQTPRGIQGEMKKSRLHLSLLGHNKDGTIKITYRIPDGIQGVSSSHRI